MQNNRVWQRACGLVRTVVEGVRFDEAGDAVIVSVRSDAGHTRDFDAMAAWLAVRTSKSATCQLLRVVWRNPRRQQQLDWIAKTDPKLWRAYLFKEGLRYVFAVKGAEGNEALDKGLTWARRSQLPSRK